jgi:viroplasmin and RNaseH domain-containing protein
MGNKGKKKFYAVARGHNTGIFRSWPLCEAQVGEQQEGKERNVVE